MTVGLALISTSSEPFRSDSPSMTSKPSVANLSGVPLKRPETLNGWSGSFRKPASSAIRAVLSPDACSSRSVPTRRGASPRLPCRETECPPSWTATRSNRNRSSVRWIRPLILNGATGTVTPVKAVKSDALGPSESIVRSVPTNPGGGPTRPSIDASALASVARRFLIS